MTIKGVLFDFSGTLLRVEATASWLTAAAEALGVVLSEAEVAAYARRLEEVGALPGGSTPREVPPRLRSVWERRDISPELHRSAYTQLTRQVELPHPGLPAALYERHMLPAAWQPYPDTREVLRSLSERGAPVAVVSNIGWDLRPVFRAHGLDRYVDAYALSYEHGCQKPDAELFRLVCAALDLPPADVLMVGDDRRNDGGAARLGCAVHLVEHLPVPQRTKGLLPVLDRVG
ncbi:HAD family hydrolase [Streptomyces oceani]|uniref:Hydrolase n=1 Tax=Streptomyces oceani TaxID=1075402 RepID=A0A1E7JXX1_9ACTN|nr:HAD-IA family hydrolase [Streptomyces oceani]OEU96524.1 hydrolase [Streptomyces oceani]